jgi:hypothetical protein
MAQHEAGLNLSSVARIQTAVNLSIRLQNEDTIDGKLKVQFFMKPKLENPATAAPRQKKIVRYHELRACRVGHHAVIRPIDHPDIPAGEFGRTTVVLAYDSVTGIAETANTRYIPGPFAAWHNKAEDTLPGRAFDLTVPAMFQ